MNVIVNVNKKLTCIIIGAYAAPNPAPAFFLLGQARRKNTGQERKTAFVHSDAIASQSDYVKLINI